MQPDLGICQHLDTVEFQYIAGADIEVEKLHLGMLEQRLGGGGEVGIARANADDQVGVPSQQVGGQAAGFADTADIQRVAGDDGALAGLGLGKGDLKALGKSLQRGIRAGVLDPATADNQRFALGLEQRDSVAQHRFGGRAALQTVHALLQEIIGVIPGLGLHVLGQGQGHRAGFGRVGQDTHSVDRRTHQLLGTVDAIPVLAHRTKRVVGADAQVMELFDLLQHRVRLAAGIHIAGQQ